MVLDAKVKEVFGEVAMSTEDLLDGPFIVSLLLRGVLYFKVYMRKSGDLDGRVVG